MNKRLVPRETQNEELYGEVAGITFNPVGIGSAHLGKITKMKDGQKLSLRGKKP